MMPHARFNIEISGGTSYVLIVGPEELYRKDRDFTVVVTTDPFPRFPDDSGVAVGKGTTPAEALTAAMKQVRYFDEPLAE